MIDPTPLPLDPGADPSGFGPTDLHRVAYELGLSYNIRAAKVIIDLRTQLAGVTAELIAAHCLLDEQGARISAIEAELANGRGE